MSLAFHHRLAFAGAALLAATGLGLAASHPVPGAPEGAHAARSERPNIVVVMTDDQALSQAAPQYMPRVTKLLRDQGTSFENAFLTTPLCCPSRATLLTGQYGHNNGVLRNAYPLLRNKRNVLPVCPRRLLDLAQVREQPLGGDPVSVLVLKSALAVSKQSDAERVASTPHGPRRRRRGRTRL